MKKRQALLFLFILFQFAFAYSQKLVVFEKSLYKCGLKDQSGKVVVKPIYNGIKDDSTHFVLYGKNNQSATLMSYDGKVIIPPKYLDLEISGDKRYYKATAYNAKYDRVHGYIDLAGNEVVPVKYHEIEDYYNDKYLIVRGMHKEYGLISVGTGSGITDYREVTPTIHNDLTMKTLKDGRLVILVRDIHGRYAALDSSGAMVTNYVNWFLPLKFIDTENWIAQDNDSKKYGLVDAFLKPIIPFEYESMYSDRTNKDQYIVYKNKKVGILDKTGKVIVDIKYDNIRHPDCSMVPVKLNNKWGILDIHGNEVLPFEYDDIGDCSVFEIDLLKDNKWRRIDIFSKKIKTQNEVFSDVVATFDDLGKGIIKKIDEFAFEHNSIQKTKYTTEYELEKRFKELLNTLGYDIKYDIRKATGILEDYLKQYPNLPEPEKNHLRSVINEFNTTWNNLDKAKSFKDTIFTIKEETVEGVIEDILKKH